MSYQVIARKYRPQRFSDVVGQEHVTQTLTNAVAQKRIAHAYLFVGPRGTGKTTIARIFAKCLNCTDGPSVDFPDSDPRCQEIVEGRSLDVLEIDGASNRGIEEIRELRDTVKYAPATSRFKIYIIDEVHMLTKEAFNALLKTLEEPPAHVKFMFATTEPEKVLPTILSRCQRFDLRRIPVSLIVQHLAAIATQEKVKAEQGALHAIARGSDGGMRDAESALDQLISFCGEKIVEEDVLSMFGLTAQGQILDLATAILAGDASTVLRELNELARHGKDLSRLLSDLLGHFRNLLVYKVSRGDLNLLEVSETEAASLQAQAATVEIEPLTRMMEVLTDAEGRLSGAASKKIFVEVTMLKAIQARHAVSIDALLEQLTSLKGDSGAASSGSKSTAPVSAPPSKPTPPAVSRTVSATAATAEALPMAPVMPLAPVATAAPSPPPAVSVPAPVVSVSETGTFNLADLWVQLVEAIGRASPFMRSYFLEAHPVSLARHVLTIGFDPEFADHIGLVDNQRTHALVQTKLQELGHAQTQVKFIQAEAPERPHRPETGPAVPEAAPSVPAATAPAVASAAVPPASGAVRPPVVARAKSAPLTLSAEEFKNDPLIKAALEIFKGQIVEIRA